jgi:hypothetical protein
MGVSGIRSVAFRPRAVIQESTVHQGAAEHVFADAMGIFKEFSLLGNVCDDLRGYVRCPPSAIAMS